MKYMILTQASQSDYDALAGKPGTQPSWSMADFAALGAFMESFNRELVDSGELVATFGLAAPSQAQRIRIQAGVPVLTDGPYAETEEVLAGFWIVECDGPERAAEIATRLTKAPGPAGIADRAYVDVRPIAGSRDELAG